jgi:hypothetical protein
MKADELGTGYRDHSVSPGGGTGGGDSDIPIPTSENQWTRLCRTF